MIERAFIRQQGNGKLAHEEQLVANELKVRGIPFSLYTLKKIHRRQLPLTPNTLVVGDMDCIYGALRQFNIPIPAADSYPEPIRHHLHRQVWKSTLGREENRFQNRFPNPTFIKPRGRQKCFTGFVFDSSYDFQRVRGVSRKEPVYCSEVVEWQSEYRIYVVNGEIRSIDYYEGNKDVHLDLAVVQNALENLRSSGRSFNGYGIDFGVLSSGETALIEMNDGFALGAYTIDAKDYMDLILARWLELTKNCKMIKD